ncbi:metalloregulator ArsR/SmtB family transcription factor [Paenibacillus sp. FSL R10-2778]|uniref:ArsR/SmtB family transcription factor n=1 Tax=Paenibacillus sp. FSL R10-2778 TaxID=2954659 RepID=UPI003159080F
MSSLQTLNRKIKTVVSPFHELLCSLHVFHQPEHHPTRLQWALELKKRMPLALQENIHTLGQLSERWIALLDLPDRMGVPISCNQGITLLKKLPDAELVYLFMNQEIALSTIVEWLNESESIRSLMKLSGNVKYLINNLASVRKLLISTLITYEHDYFGQEWDYIEPFMNISAAQFQDLASRFPEKALNTLHPRLLSENGTLTVQKAVTYYFPYDQLGQVYVFPSTFIFPHLLVGWFEDTLFLPLTVDVPGLAFSEGPPSDLLRQLKALSDDTRMRILKLLWKGPHCTKQLAPILGISEAAVSKQLKQLSEAGFTQSQRKGNYLFYSVNKEVFDNLLILQRQYLEQ